MEFKQLMYGQRISSFTGNPNSLGILLMLSILICFYFIKQKKSFWLFILIIIFFYTLLLTGSRASMVGMIAGGALFIDHSYLERGIGRRSEEHTSELQSRGHL